MTKKTMLICNALALYLSGWVIHSINTAMLFMYKGGFPYSVMAFTDKILENRRRAFMLREKRHLAIYKSLLTQRKKYE